MVVWKTHRVRLLVVALLCTHAAALAWSGARHSIVWDEVGHLAAGLSHWRLGRFNAYCVNPPLVRSVAALPVVLAGPTVDWGGFSTAPGSRSEFELGRRFLDSNAGQWHGYLVAARWVCIPLSLLGAFVCYRWACSLYGRSAGVLALALWCFSPNILAHAQLITPDVGAAALGVAAVYVFRGWLQRPTWRRACAAGVVLGFAELTKTTWIVLFPLLPLLWLLWRWPRPAGMPASAPRRLQETFQVALILVIALYTINAGYGFEGSCQRLKDYQFISKTLGGPTSGQQSIGPGRNRFANTWLGMLPVPLPKYYVAGIDLQKRDFESKMWSYLRGKWRLGGWWYYYLYGAAIKEPVGTSLLLLTAIAAGLSRCGYAASWREEFTLLAPLLVILVLVSSQTGFNHHLRYLLPAFPFAMIWVSKLARSFRLGHRAMAAIVAIALTWSVGSSLWIYPHSMPYFNELVGGPAKGHLHLGASNVDWGQDLLYLKRWLDEHPEVQPLTLVHDLPLVDPRALGIEAERTPPEPTPGWHAISSNQIHGRSGEYRYFLDLRPAAMASYCMFIYHITPDEANRLRESLGLPPYEQPSPRPAGPPKNTRKPRT